VAAEPDSFRDDLESGIEPSERAHLWLFAEMLMSRRPYPRAAFRATIRQSLGGDTRDRPRALWGRVAALALPGVVLLALVAVGIGHAGPFAP
jgi:hypothetical protein